MLSDALGAGGAVGLSLAMGLLSALVPFVNAEVYAVALGLKAGPLTAVFCAVALGVGQTGGKWVWFTSGRSGAQVHARRRARRATLVPGGAGDGPAGAADPAAAQERERLAGLKARLQDRRSSAGLVLLSASVGLPPLALVSVAAGATRMRPRDFLLCCLLGRTARFCVVLVPLALR